MTTPAVPGSQPATEATVEWMRELAERRTRIVHVPPPALRVLLDIIDEAASVERVDYEAMRVERGWPTPMHLHRVADALDVLALPAGYGDVLRWFGDLCDAALQTPDAGEPLPDEQQLRQVGPDVTPQGGSDADGSATHVERLREVLPTGLLASPYPEAHLTGRCMFCWYREEQGHDERCSWAALQTPDAGER